MTSVTLRQSGGANIVSIPKAILNTLGLQVGSKLVLGSILGIFFSVLKVRITSCNKPRAIICLISASVILYTLGSLTKASEGSLPLAISEPSSMEDTVKPA